jgi:hypothetical protein
MIKDLSELKKLLQLCRKQGVTEIEFENVKLKLGDLPQSNTTTQDTEEVFEDLTPDQLAFYSSGVSEDGFNQ